MGQNIKVKFSFDRNLVKTMKLFQGRYNKKDKTWWIQKAKIKDLKEELHYQNCKVIEVGGKDYSVTRQD